MPRFHVYIEREQSEREALEQELDFRNGFPPPWSVWKKAIYKRTTVSLPDILADLLSIKLEKIPGSEEAHREISDWLQIKINDHKAPHTEKLSKWLQSEATLFIADKQIISQYREKLNNT